MTRNAYARQEESKLSLALSELKASKECCDRLNKEIDDNERVLLEAHEKNRKLNNEMAQLYIQFTDAIDARDRLQIIVDGFSECSTEYEQTLSRNHVLQQQLHEAQNQITQLETSNLNITTSLNQSLFNELVPLAPSMVSAINPSYTIDLTGADVSCNSVRVVTSKNKLKKYVKINKYIVKTQRMVKRQKFFIKNVKLNRERLNLLKQLDMYSFHLEQTTRRYNADTEDLQSELDHLQEKLSSMTKKYNTSENLMREYVLAMNDLVSSQSDTCEHCQPPSNVHTLDHSLSTFNTTLPQPCIDSPIVKSSCIQHKQSNKNDVVVFCDEIGKDLGHLLTTEYPGHSIINNCMPGCSLYNIMKKIIKCNFNPDSTIIIFVGNRGTVNKTELLQYHRTLCNLSVKKIVMFTLPYSKSLPQEENYCRYKINKTMHNLSCYSNGFQIIDTNIYVGDYFYLTKDRYLVDRYYLSNYCRRQIAVSLSYFFCVTAKNLAKQLASFEQCNFSLNSSANNVTLHDIHNHLN